MEFTSFSPLMIIGCPAAGAWDVYFGPLRLGRFQERTDLLEDALGRHRRRNH